MNQSITIDELMAEMQRLERQQPDGLTSSEIAQMLGWRQEKVVKALLHPLIRADRIVVGNKSVMSIAGRVAVVPVYMLRRGADAKAQADQSDNRRKRVDRKTREAEKGVRVLRSRKARNRN